VELTQASDWRRGKSSSSQPVLLVETPEKEWLDRRIALRKPAPRFSGGHLKSAARPTASQGPAKKRSKIDRRPRQERPCPSQRMMDASQNQMMLPYVDRCRSARANMQKEYFLLRRWETVGQARYSQRGMYATIGGIPLRQRILAGGQHL